MLIGHMEKIIFKTPNPDMDFNTLYKEISYHVDFTPKYCANYAQCCPVISCPRNKIIVPQCYSNFL